MRTSIIVFLIVATFFVFASTHPIIESTNVNNNSRNYRITRLEKVPDDAPENNIEMREKIFRSPIDNQRRQFENVEVPLWRSQNERHQLIFRRGDNSSGNKHTRVGLTYQFEW